MELAQLRIYVAAARSGSFSQTARALYISHSTVSRAVAGLERELGVVLMLRDRHGLTTLTAAGQLLLELSEQLLKDTEDIAARVRTAADKQIETW